MTDQSILSSLNAMDATGLREFAKEHGIKVTPLPNVRPETLRNEITTELEKRAASDATTGHAGETAATDDEVAGEASAPPPEPAAEAQQLEPGNSAEVAAATDQQAHDDEQDAEGDEQKGEVEPAEPVATVRMKLVNHETGDKTFADVHPLEVQNFADHGYVKAEDEGEDHGEE